MNEWMIIHFRVSFVIIIIILIYCVPPSPPSSHISICFIHRYSFAFVSNNNKLFQSPASIWSARLYYRIYVLSCFWNWNWNWKKRSGMKMEMTSRPLFFIVSVNILICCSIQGLVYIFLYSDSDRCFSTFLAYSQNERKKKSKTKTVCCFSLNFHFYFYFTVTVFGPSISFSLHIYIIYEGLLVPLGVFSFFISIFIFKTTNLSFFY